MKYLPYGLFAVALGVAWGFSRTHDPSLRRVESGVFALLLGLSAVLWGVNELRSGKALIIHESALREERPFVFWSVILVFRFAIGAILLGAGLWRLVVGPAG